MAGWSTLEYWHGGKPLEPVRASRKHGGDAALPSTTSVSVFHGERAVTRQSFDPRPSVRRRDPGAQVTSGLLTLGPRAPRLHKHRTSTQHPSASTLTLRSKPGFEIAYAISKLGDQLRGGAELRRHRQRGLELIGHRAVRS